MDKKVVIAGGTGFVGKYLQDQFRLLGYEVYIISRQKQSIQWGDNDRMVQALENSEMLINLAGKSVDCRYTEKNKEAILKSRTETTRRLGDALLKCKHPPGLWINSSAATIYREAEDKPMTESEGEIGNGFSVSVAKAWEEEFFSFNLPHTRQAALRISVVLGKDGGVMKPLRKLVRLGLGGRQGSGKQMFSWIHMEDMFRIILFLQSNQDLKGVFICSSPDPVSNAIFMETLRKVMNVKWGVPSPAWLLEIGALIIRTEAELVVKSRWVLPEKLLAAGYTFKYPGLEGALNDIFREGE